MNRRDLIALPAAAIVPTVALGAETPVMVLFRDWKLAFDRANRTPGLSDDELEIDDAKARRLVKQMMHLPAHDARDVCAKLTAFTYDGEFFVDDDGTLSGPMLAEARRMIGVVR